MHYTGYQRCYYYIYDGPRLLLRVLLIHFHATASWLPSRLPAQDFLKDEVVNGIEIAFFRHSIIVKSSRKFFPDLDRHRA